MPATASANPLPYREDAGFLISDADSGKRLAAAHDALEAEDKAQEWEGKGHRVRVDPAPVPFGPTDRAAPAPAAALEQADAPEPDATDVPEGYKLLSPRPLAASTRSREFERWVIEAAGFPVEWGRWGEGHTTAMIAYACMNRGLIEIAVPIKGHKPYLYRQKPKRGSV